MGNRLSKRRSKRKEDLEKKYRKSDKSLQKRTLFETENAKFEGTFLNCSFETRTPGQIGITPIGAETKACNCSSDQMTMVHPCYLKALETEVQTLRNRLDFFTKKAETLGLLSNFIENSSTNTSDTDNKNIPEAATKDLQTHGVNKTNTKEVRLRHATKEKPKETRANDARQPNDVRSHPGNATLPCQKTHNIGDTANPSIVCAGKRILIFSKTSPGCTVSETNAATRNKKKEPNVAQSTMSDKEHITHHFDIESSSSPSDKAENDDSTVTLRPQNGSQHNEQPEVVMNNCQCIVCDNNILKDDHVLNFMTDATDTKADSGSNPTTDGESEENDSASRDTESSSGDESQYEIVRDVASDNLKLYFKPPPFKKNETSSCIQIDTDNVY